jgi:hypothetical protein
MKLNDFSAELLNLKKIHQTALSQVSEKLLVTGTTSRKSTTLKKLSRNSEEVWRQFPQNFLFIESRRNLTRSLSHGFFFLCWKLFPFWWVSANLQYFLGFYLFIPNQFWFRSFTNLSSVIWIPSQNVRSPPIRDNKTLALFALNFNLKW